MEKIQFGNPFEKTIFMYDIACLLYKYLKLNGKDDLLLGYTFAVPVFHRFAHNIQCQLQFAQRNVEGTGLANGEGTERLWSYLRTMSRITKEMSLDNRHDCLVDSLHHYATKLQLILACLFEEE
ncbi:uncharacterized protein LOC117316961 [Pecten maximus]|uniref:uncharacterized protein LOC117316961 n=1 Tax=Pecten maximus TaxID=6579 RepID=UPI00145848F5|nr:uncharacterized protein LOC117316961 [Pecten maximus]